MRDSQSKSNGGDARRDSQRDVQGESRHSEDETTIFANAAMSAGSAGTIYSRFVAHHTPFSFQTRDRSALDYHPMPYQPEPGDTLMLEEPWRIILEMHGDEQRRVLGLDLYGDVTLGRGRSRPGRILVNLEPYNAQEMGVSREHALLRPTQTQLYVLDQGSRNGTVVNGARSARGVATALKNGDLLRLGNLLLMVHITRRPGQYWRK